MHALRIHEKTKESHIQETLPAAKVKHLTFSCDEIKSQGLFYNEEHINSLKQYQEQFKEVKDEKSKQI